MKSLIIILLTGLVSFSLSNVHSQSTMESLVMPFVCAGSLFALLCWCIVWRWNTRFGGEREMDLAEMGIDGDIITAAHARMAEAEESALRREPVVSQS